MLNLVSAIIKSEQILGKINDRGILYSDVTVTWAGGGGRFSDNGTYKGVENIVC